MYYNKILILIPSLSLSFLLTLFCCWQNEFCEVAFKSRYLQYICMRVLYTYTHIIVIEFRNVFVRSYSFLYFFFYFFVLFSTYTLLLFPMLLYVQKYADDISSTKIYSFDFHLNVELKWRVNVKHAYLSPSTKIR